MVELLGVGGLDFDSGFDEVDELMQLGASLVSLLCGSVKVVLGKGEGTQNVSQYLTRRGSVGGALDYMRMINVY